MSRRWILGAADPEMAEIERLLDSVGERWHHATSDGVRCSARTAYAMDRVECDPGEEIILVECDGDGLDETGRVRRIDHHRPGDPGYGRDPGEFLAASSIGQVVAHLSACHQMPAWEGWWDRTTPAGTVHLGYVAAGVDRRVWMVADGASARVVPELLVLTAAADHCLGAAYRGECPGVDPDTLMRWRVTERARFQGRPEAEILADIEATRRALRDAPLMDLGDGIEPLRDMRREDAIGGPWPELPEAGAREVLGYMSGPLRGRDAPDKFTCSGRPEQVSAWMRWAESRLTGIYGDPARGFAGGYEAAR